MNGEASFREISGLNVSPAAEPVREGTEVHRNYRLPTPPQFENLVLKRGVVSDRAVRTWIEKAVEGFEFIPMTVTIQLLNSESNVQTQWTLTDARPVKWEVSTFDSTSGEVSVESLELVFSSVSAG